MNEQSIMPIITRCPICGKDDKIQKVSAVVSTNQHHGSSSGSSVGLTYDGDFAVTEAYTSLNTNSISELAKALSPPDEPKRPPNFDGCFGCLGRLGRLFLVFTGFGLWFLLLTLAEVMKLDDMIVIIFAVCVGGALLLWLFIRYLGKDAKEARLKAQKAQSESAFLMEHLAWKTAMARWTRAYYCHRDGVVFDPETNETCPPEAMRQLFFKHE